ncbi:MAG: hypothetical protein MZW92_52010 [Comamonadaceae bacterium]|nr:hypothetical protein [Comamonadaceae bacterium]
MGEAVAGTAEREAIAVTPGRAADPNRLKESVRTAVTWCWWWTRARRAIRGSCCAIARARATSRWWCGPSACASSTPKASASGWPMTRTCARPWWSAIRRPASSRCRVREQEAAAVAKRLEGAGFDVTALDRPRTIAMSSNALYARDYRLLHLAAHGVYEYELPPAPPRTGDPYRRRRAVRAGDGHGAGRRPFPDARRDQSDARGAGTGVHQLLLPRPGGRAGAAGATAAVWPPTSPPN